MATLERDRSQQEPERGRALHNINENEDIAAPGGTVPTPFPRTTSRSPSASRALGGGGGVAGVFSKVKRAISSSRERSSDSARPRADRRTSATGDIAEEQIEQRGRTGGKADYDDVQLKATATNTTMQTSTTATATRSQSRGRPVLTTGRGGAGNMRDANLVSTANGEEDAGVVNAAREQNSRSRSRGRGPEVVVAGRGGRGNITSPTRAESEVDRLDRLEEEARFERETAEARRKIEGKSQQRMWSSGRGGAGNIRAANPTS